MPWEKRGNHSYYYRKRRVGRRVVSEYVGRGEVAETIAALDETDRARKAKDREDQRRAFERMRQRVEDGDGVINEIEDIIRVITRAALLAEGFHTHKGQWRRKSYGDS